MAIEFALFGLGSEPGGSVLRLGQEEGEVMMVFDVGGTDYEVTRRLQRRAGRVQQSDGVLKSPSETLSLSPSELKEKMLEVLEFNEAPDPRAQSWIYRYAVYTPQEEMKNILALAPDQRLQILRRAFRVEDYKTVASNAEETAGRIREDAREQDGIARGLDELRGQAELLRSEAEAHRTELSDLKRAESEAEEQLRLARDEEEGLRKREASLQGVKTEKEYYERLRSDAAEELASAEQESARLRRELDRTRGSVAAETERPSPAGSLPELKRKERTLEAKAKKLTELKAAAEVKLSDYESIMRNGVCPVCDRPAEAHDFEGRKARKDAEREHLASELSSVEEEIKGVREEIEAVRTQREEAKELALRRSECSRLKAEIERREQQRHRFEKRAAFADATLRQLGRRLEELQGVTTQVEATSRRVADAEERLRAARDRLVRASGLMEAAQKRQKEVDGELAAKEEALGKSRSLREREIWLGDYFVPTVKAIEKSVLATINQEFDSLFKRWFGMLVSDPDKEVSVDDDFAPTVSQGGYEQDVKYLSGGERTSVALAYRLALNMLAQKASVGMKSNLLILDEPTDGFSKEQLGNVREVLDEVGCPQVIVVSHDRELESFADQIFRVEKAGSESAVRTP